MSRNQPIPPMSSPSQGRQPTQGDLAPGRSDLAAQKRQGLRPGYPTASALTRLTRGLLTRVDPLTAVLSSIGR